MKTLFALVLTSFLSTQAFADLPAGTKIATCTAAADANNPEETLILFFKGSDRNDKTEYAVHYAAANFAGDFPVQELEWLDGGSTLGFRFANFLIVNLHNGKSNQNTIGVALGAAPRPMSCDANF